jgi:hypothetical protein
MSDSSDIEDTLIDNMVSGVAEKQIGDRRYRYHSPSEVYDIAKKIAADEKANSGGPFLKVRFVGPSV